MSDEPGASEKAAMRSLMRRRLSAPGIEPGAIGRSIEGHLRASACWDRAASVVAFASLPGEVDTSAVLAAVLAAGKRLLLPRTLADRSLEFVEVGDLDRLTPGRFGVREPSAGRARVEFDGETLILVPGLAFDCHGGRLGRGAGYYDRALARARATNDRPVCLGLGFALQLVDRVPMTRLDQRLDGVLTELGLDFVEGSSPAGR